MAKPFLIAGNTIRITTSIGITINDLSDRNGVDQLLQQAHIALYQAKQQGRSQYKFYSSEINAQLQELHSQQIMATELQQRGCHEGQGFYFSRPVPGDAIAQMLKKNSSQIMNAENLIIHA